MFAIVEVAGNQLKVSPSDRLCVPKRSEKAGSSITLNNVLLVADEKNVKVGAPYVKGATVKANVIGHKKDDKVIVFKKKKRKGYRVTRGHRQQFTEIEITSIN